MTCENSKPGTPDSEWNVIGPEDDTIKGFATDISVNRGSTIAFKVRTSVPYTMKVYRLGWYQGLGAREVATLSPTARNQPECLRQLDTGLVDCGNWGVSATWAVPATAVSGVYVVRLTRIDDGGASHIPFIVRDDASTSQIVFQTSDTTWQAYNTYGGNSLYFGDNPNTQTGRAYKVSYNRPFDTRNTASGQDYLFSNEYPMIRFLESNGYDVSYTSGIDSDRRGDLLRNHRVFMSTGHDEYWSGPQRANVEAARDAGVHLAFFSGNDVYWKTRYEPAIDGSGTSYRTLVTYKETFAGGKIDPSPEWTGTWRDPRLSPPADGGRPENALTGTAYMSNFTDLPIQVPAAQGRNRFWRNTSVASLQPGQTATLAAHTVGYESNEDLDNGFRPPGLFRLSTTTGPTPEYLQDFGTRVLPGTTTHHMTTYRAASGALVFSAGTIQYAWALDDYHDGQPTTVDPALRQAVVNLLADMGAQPRTLVAGLVAATASTDTTAPTSTITAPAASATLANGATTTVSGTASDIGGVVSGVEVSVDGVTWHPAEGTTSWTYSFRPSGSGPVPLRSRAIDDSGNLQGTPTTRSVTVTCPCSLYGDATPKTADAGDPTAVELGVRFTVEQSGFVSGVRFFKAPGNTGVHVGSLWGADGSLLRRDTFTAESASGWQTLNFSEPLAVSAGAELVVSYRAPNGRYAADAQAFSTRDISSAPLRAFRSNGTSRNGVFAAPGQFPNQSFGDSNYFVDPVFTTAATLAPAVATASPAGGATGANRYDPVTVRFNVAVQPGTPVLALTTGNGTAVPGTTTLDAAGRVLTFTPAEPLAALTAYGVQVSGAVSSGGVPMSAPATWNFTTVSPCPCTVFAADATPAQLDSGDNAAVELGMRFVPSVSGTVTGVRFYKSAANLGTHTGSIWAPDGSLLRTGTFTNETLAGWQTLTFANPLPVTAGTTYVVSYLAPQGRYSTSQGFFTDDFNAGAIKVLAANNGVFRYGGGFPGNSLSGPNYWVDVVFVDGVVPDTSAPVVSGVSGVGGPSISKARVTWGTDEPASSSVAFGTSPDALTSVVSPAGLRTSHAVELTGLTPGTTYYFRVTSTDGSGNSVTVPAGSVAPGSFTTLACPCSVFAANAVPAEVDAGDNAAVELGMRFVPSVSGTVTGVRFYKSAANLGTHTGSIWAPDGTRLRTGTFSGESASGWQTLMFANPLPVTAGATYVVSYFAPQGRYSVSGGFFAADVNAEPLVAPAAGNGAFRYGGGFPGNSLNGPNYWVDVVFVDGAVADTSAPMVSGVSGVPGPSISRARVSWTTDEPASSSVAYGTSPDALTTVVAPGGLRTAHSVELTGLTAGTTYYFRVTSADGAGNSVTVPASGVAPGSFTTSGCPCTVLGNGVPAQVDSGDNAAVELGMRFVPSMSGTVTGVRFYKSAANLGTHTGSIWAPDGTRLRTGTFSGESASGWQTLTFANPLPVTAGTTYVVSYFAPQGRFSVTGGFFAADVNAEPLVAPAAGNGSFRYGGGFPGNSLNGPNYWVDVVFVDGVVPDTAAPVVSGVAGVAGPSISRARVSWGTDEPASSSVAFGTSPDALTSVVSPGGLRTAHSVELTGLAPGTTYYFRVTSVDGSGNSVTVPGSGVAPGSFTTLACPCSLFAADAVPAEVDAGDNAAVELGMRFVPSVSGTVSGVRFFKSAANVGTHTGSVWASDGSLLRTGTFSGESASGWQTLTFANPLPVTAGTTYVVSYFAPQGRYSVTGGFFAADVNAEPLVAPAAGNGSFRYGGGFPGNSLNGPNYWVDVVFETT